MIPAFLLVWFYGYDLGPSSVRLC